jgi:protein-S-isoprenylcysteine O-methyltransferase Ste14
VISLIRTAIHVSLFVGVTRGPYRYLRNPMALGVGLAIAGIGLVHESAAYCLRVGHWWPGRRTHGR